MQHALRNCSRTALTFSRVQLHRSALFCTWLANYSGNEKHDKEIIWMTPTQLKAIAFPTRDAARLGSLTGTGCSPISFATAQRTGMDIAPNLNCHASTSPSTQTKTLDPKPQHCSSVTSPLESTTASLTETTSWNWRRSVSASVSCC